ncbi:thiamine pyrophosphate-binding protein [Bradyrhizobium mercantei]|uniref:thiamine pyrophosphate-binding protein n=1 Tax=Bradyrhizobium mercantei TaxID=1904807 RepID=UPI001AECDB04|nr:thiamine pyrophosphate-binding protein [Bradyrhizobium mercantei]
MSKKDETGMQDTKVATIVVNALQEIGVKYVFGVPSGGWIDYMEALRKADGMEFILATHEGGAAMMADVCGRLSNVPGVCFGTFGPGATNLSTGVGEALLDRSPMIALTDEMPESMRGRTTQMGIDHQALFAPLTKKTTRLRADSVKSILFDAATVALSGRPGPVHVGLPVGLSAEQASAENIAFKRPLAKEAARPQVLDQVVQQFNQAKRPLLAIGLGAVHAGVRTEITEFAHKHGLPVVLTPMAKGMLPEDDASYTGVLFHALSDMVGITHQEADLVIAVGYDPVEFNYESWLSRNATLVNLDVEPADIDRNIYKVGAEAVGDIRSSLKRLLEVPPKKTDWDMDAMAMRRAAMFAKLQPLDRSFGPKGALQVLREVLPSTGIMTCDVGAHTHLIGQLWPTPAPGLQIMTNGWSTMGFGIPAAIAAKLSCPDKDVCAVVGDGGFLMTAGELATAVRYKLKIVVVVLTDNDLALIRIKQEKKGNPIYGTPVRETGTIGGPNIFGVPVLVARDAVELREQLRAAFAADGPVVVEALVDSREYDNLVLKKDKPA